MHDVFAADCWLMYTVGTSATQTRRFMCSLTFSYPTGTGVPRTCSSFVDVGDSGMIYWDGLQMLLGDPTMR